MARIEWDKIGERNFETGVDRGVIYAGKRISGEGEGVFWVTEAAFGHPWNGLISVDERSEDSAVKTTYFDGVKNNTIVAPGVFEAEVRAFTYPDKLNEFVGTDSFRVGVNATHQRPRKTFGFTYRTLKGNDLVAEEAGYVIHLVYGCAAIPLAKTRKTIESNVEPLIFGWTFKSSPELVPDHRPISHIEVDSTKVDSTFLSNLENALYGTPSAEPYMPPIDDILSNFVFMVTDNGDGTWTAEGPDEYFTLYDSVPDLGLGDDDGVGGKMWEIHGIEADRIDEDNYLLYSHDPPPPDPL